MRLLCVKSKILFIGEKITNIDGAAHMPRKPLYTKTGHKLRYTSGRYDESNNIFTPACRGNSMYISFDWPTECTTLNEVTSFLNSNGLTNISYLHIYTDLDSTPKSVHVIVLKSKGKENVQ